MSEEMKNKRVQEELVIEEHQKMLDDAVIKDVCPNCGTHARNFLYYNTIALKMFGWLECTACGNVFCPESIRKQKLNKPDVALVSPTGTPLMAKTDM